MKISKKQIVNQIYNLLLKNKKSIIDVRQRLVDKEYFTYQSKVIEFCSDGSQIIDTPYAQEISIYIKYKEKNG